jgi:hypothetical protein
MEWSVHEIQHFYPQRLKQFNGDILSNSMVLEKASGLQSIRRTCLKWMPF